MCPLIRITTTNILANTQSNPFQGNQYEYLPFAAALAFAIIANAATIDTTVFSGSDVLQQGGPPTVKATITTTYPDDFLLDDIGGAGERINVVNRETGAISTTDLETSAKISPLG